VRGRGDRRPRPARATAFDPEAPLHPATKSPLWTMFRWFKKKKGGATLSSFES
jgi:hypothetical protein